MTSLSIEIADKVAIVTIQRADSCNAIDITIVREMHEALDRFQTASSNVRAIVITGSNGVFCSGLNLHSVDTISVRNSKQRLHYRMRRYMDPLVLRLNGFRIPIVAAINGAAVGAGMSFALATDILVMGQDAYFSPSFARLGKVPDAGITRTLSRRIGGGRAIASLMLADKIDAKNALRWGIVYCVVPNSEVVAHAVDVAKRLAKAPDNLLRRIRELNSSTYENSIGEQLKAERRAQDLSKGMRGCAEGIDAFFQKREPQFEEL